MPDVESVLRRANGAASRIFGDAPLAILVGLHVLLIWHLPRFPTQDGPTHMHNADVLLRYGESERGVFEEYYTLNPIPSPNWTGHLALATLLSVFDPVVAEKAFLTIYAVLLPLGIRSALRAVRPASGALAVLALPFVFSWLLHMGFYNFCAGLALWSCGLAYWLRRGGLWNVREVGLFSLLLVLIYFSNAVALFLLLAFIAIDGVWRSVVERGPNAAASDGETARRRSSLVWGRLAAPLVASAPALLAFSVYQRHQGVGVIRWAPFMERVRELATLDVLVALRDSERVVAVLYAALLFAFLAAAAITRIRRGGLERSDSLWIASGAFIALALAAPKEVGGGWLVSHRVTLLAALTAIVAGGAAPVPARVARATMFGAAVAAIAFLAVRGRAARDLSDVLAEYASAAPAIAPGSTILGLSFSHRGTADDGSVLAPRIAAFLHASAVLAVERGGVDLGNYEGNSTVFPLRFRPERNPFRLIGFQEGLEAEPPRADFIHYTERTGATVDYVVLGGVRAEHDHDLRAKAIFKQLAMSYERVFVSPGRGIVQVYTRRGVR